VGGQLYPPDLVLLQPIHISIPYGDSGWTPDIDMASEDPALVKVTCIKDVDREIVWDPAVIGCPTSPFRAYRSPEFIRIFAVGSQIHDRARLVLAENRFNIRRREIIIHCK
jgi:hypothetical protein